METGTIRIATNDPVRLNPLDSAGIKIGESGGNGDRNPSGEQMPLFEYQCQACGKVFEVLTQRRNLSALPKCPECGGSEVERLFSAFSATSGEVGSCGASPLGFG